MTQSSGGIPLILWITAIAAGVLVYFLPTIIAVLRRHPRRKLISVLNLFLGWTLLGWLALLVWLSSFPDPPRRSGVVFEDLPAESIPVPTSPPPEFQGEFQASAPRDPGPMEEHRLPCPFCAEAVLPAARVCRYCGRDLPPGWQSGPARGAYGAG